MLLNTESIYLAAIIQGLFQMAVLVFIRRGDQQANRMLALLVGLLVLSLWNIYTYILNLPSYWRTIDYNGWYSPLLWGPVLYFYVGMISDEMRLDAAQFLSHLSPGIILFVIGIAIQLLHSFQWLTPSHVEIFNNIQLLAFYIQISLYLLMSFQLIKSYNYRVRNNFSSIDKMNLSWLQRLLAIFSVIVIIDMCITVPSVINHVSEVPYFEYFLFAEAAAIFTIGYLSLLHAESIFRNRKPKYESSPLNKQLSLDLAAKLKMVMQDSEPHKNNELKLSDLAQLVGISPYYLSQIINEQYQKNFYDFVNEYRARSAAELLMTSQNSNVSQIAFNSGFNNRVSFNNAFKKYIGMTPSQYRRSRSTTIKEKA